MRRASSDQLFFPQRRRRRHALFALMAGVFAAAGGSAIVWNALQPQFNPISAAISESEVVPTNTEQATGVAARLHLGASEIVGALRKLEDRGDVQARLARIELSHRLSVEPGCSVSVDQIRARLASMPEAEFCAWLRAAVK